tara:strand:+ start:1068 stop:1304 length:237 start_codon:yes stop_codon:yes gene_type:complete
MAGVKKSKGQQTYHTKFYKDGQEWRPAKVVAPKMFSKGTKSYMAAQSVQTGDLYKNSHGRVAPWHSIQFTSIKPNNLD